MKELQQTHVKKISNRLKRAEGQIRGVSRMIEDSKDLSDVFSQIKAIKSALAGVESLLLDSAFLDLENTLHSKGALMAREELNKIHKYII